MFSPCVCIESVMTAWRRTRMDALENMVLKSICFYNPWPIAAPVDSICNDFALFVLLPWLMLFVCGVRADEEQRLLEENRLLTAMKLCKVCLDKDVNTVFLPCGHLVTCQDCAPRLRDCPVCRTYIRGTVKTFLSWTVWRLSYWRNSRDEVRLDFRKHSHYQRKTILELIAETVVGRI